MYFFSPQNKQNEKKKIKSKTLEIPREKNKKQI